MKKEYKSPALEVVYLQLNRVLLDNSDIFDAEIGTGGDETVIKPFG